MAAPGEFYSYQARTALAGGSDTRSRSAKLCRENQANIDRFVEHFDANTFDLAVDLIMSAPRVAVYGIRQFHALAAFLVYGLRMIRSDVVLFDANSLGHAEGFATLSKGDVFISASCAPYSKLVVEMAQTAKDLGFPQLRLLIEPALPWWTVPAWPFWSTTSRVLSRTASGLLWWRLNALLMPV